MSYLPPDNSRRRGNLLLPQPPKGVRFTRYVDGFQTDVPSGNYISGGMMMGGGLFFGFLLGGLITAPFSWLAIASAGYMGWRGMHSLLGELSIHYRDGQIRIKDGVMGIGIDETINISEIRSVKRVMTKTKFNRQGKREEIEITTTSKSILIGKLLNRGYRDFVYNTLIYYLDKSMHRID